MAIKEGWARASAQLVLVCLLWQGREKHPQEQDACKVPWQSVPQYTQQVALAVLTEGQGDTYGGSCFSLHTFYCSHGCFLRAPSKKGLGPCLWATRICWFLALKSGESSAIHP